MKRKQIIIRVRKHNQVMRWWYAHVCSNSLQIIIIIIIGDLIKQQTTLHIFKQLHKYGMIGDFSSTNISNNNIITIPLSLYYIECKAHSQLRVSKYVLIYHYTFTSYFDVRHVSQLFKQYIYI